MDIGETEVPSLETKGEFGVINAEQVEQSGVNIVHVGLVGDRVEAEFVGLAEDLARFHAATGEPHGEGVDMMVATGGIAVFSHGGASELAAPNDEGILEQASLLQVLDEGGLALIDLAADFLEVAFEVFAGATVTVPVGVIQLDEADAAFDESTGEEAVATEGWFIFFDAVKGESRSALSLKIDQFRGAGLHAGRHLVGGDAGVDFGVTGFDGTLKVQIANGVDGLALARRVDALWICQVEDGLARAAKRDALEIGGKKSGAPINGSPAGPARTGLQHDKSGEVLRLAAETVVHPRPDARPAELAGASVHKQFGRRMVEQGRLARFYQ